MGPFQEHHVGGEVDLVGPVALALCFGGLVGCMVG